MKYRLSVPPTNEQGSYNIIITVTNETKSAAALWHYNSARAHDGLEPVKRMPKGTTYTPVYFYVIQQHTGSRYGWDDVCQEDTRAEGIERLKEYRENQPEYLARMIRRRA